MSGQTAAEYAVLIADMDGRLHVNPAQWTLEAPADPEEIYKVVTDALAPEVAPENYSDNLTDLVGDASSPAWHSFGELAVKASLKDTETNALRPFITPYPVDEITRPRININTARQKTIEAILKEIPTLDAAARTAVVNKLVSERPFKNRQTMETVIAELAPDPVGDGNNTLLEEQFNDLLKSLNGTSNPDKDSIFADNGDYSASTPGDSAHYEFDFEPDPPPPGLPPSNTGGDHTSDNDVTWGCEVVFESRYYEILVLGRGWRLGSDPDAGRGRASERLLWAIYDAEDKKVIWRRWLFPADR